MRVIVIRLKHTNSNWTGRLEGVKSRPERASQLVFKTAKEVKLLCMPPLFHLQDTCQTFVGHLRDTFGIPVGHLRDTCGTPAGHLWDTCGIPAGHLWDTW